MSICAVILLMSALIADCLICVLLHLNNIVHSKTCKETEAISLKRKRIETEKHRAAEQNRKGRAEKESRKIQFTLIFLIN